MVSNLVLTSIRSNNSKYKLRENAVRNYNEICLNM